MAVTVDRQFAAYVEALARECGANDVWLIGSRANGRERADSDWDLIVFGTATTLRQMRQRSQLHRSDVDCLVVTDGEHFESAWGATEKSGSLSLWAWRQVSESTAKYEGTKWVGTDEDGDVKRSCCLATRLWPL